MRGLPKDAPEVRISKTLSWILRHGSQLEGLKMRPDGYVRVDELLQRPKMRDLTFEALQEIVRSDAKGRYSLVQEVDAETGKEAWWIRANQGHSLKTVVLDLEPIKYAADIPTGIAVHGTTKRAWEAIKDQGLSKMTRNHIHLAQGVAGSGVISGMRSSSQILIYVDVQKAIDAGYKFYISANGVVLTEGDERGFLPTQFFSRVETADGQAIPGWDGPRSSVKERPAQTSTAVGTADEVGPGKASVGVGPTTKEEAIQAPEAAGVQKIAEKIAGTSL
ncbi:KptA family-domain-containing protein [Trametes polyzona]|nr:KptA family-domain-containing protein [Trametes polyzona]